MSLLTKLLTKDAPIMEHLGDLTAETETFFPKNGSWSIECYKKPVALSRKHLPCHLRDIGWMSKLMHSKLAQKKIYVPIEEIREFMIHSERFDELRHQYELRIVNWQIDFIMHGGKNYLIPEEFYEGYMLNGKNCEGFVRDSVIKTLKAIGLHEEAIEEGLENGTNPWRELCMQQSFRNTYEPTFSQQGGVGEASQEHKANWLKLREYDYFTKNQYSVTKYGMPTENMLISLDEAQALQKTLDRQNKQRLDFIKEWQKRMTSPSSALEE